jgi:hypothetical protein
MAWTYWISKSRLQVLLKLTYLILLIVAANYAAHWVTGVLKIELRPSNEEFIHKTIIVSAIIYAFLLAIPFVPGAEIGLTLIGMFGPKIVFLVYACTIAGLLTSFIVGRLISLKALIKLFEDLHFSKPIHLLRQFEPMGMDERLRFIVSEAPNRLIPYFLRHRYLALAIVVNIPGNIIIGGGGGIALMAGISRVYSLTGFLATLAIGVSPVPIAVLLFGTEFLPL